MEDLHDTKRYLIDEALRAIKDGHSMKDFFNETIEWYPELQPIEIKMIIETAKDLYKEGY